MIEGALIFLGGLLAGVVVRSLPARRPSRDPADAVPVCQCTHPRAVHDAETSRCHDKVYRRGTGDSNSRFEPCPCRQYVGPEPLPSFFPKGLES